MMKDAEFQGKGSVMGRLVHVDGYPGLVLCDDERVTGELYLVGDRLLGELDHYEGCLESPAHYLREKTLVALENGEKKSADVYVFQLLEPHHENIENGDWLGWLAQKFT